MDHLSVCIGDATGLNEALAVCFAGSDGGGEDAADSDSGDVGDV